ncbi:hypothetical protein CPB85DRAFT_1325700 [Mucidula mucida]|nr:hypothetical protein CPB85DRAFT_1325700 [Mucidula mucida]
MWHMRRGRICGVLNDFDLSSFRDSTSPSSKQRTGTRPFMAREFHTNPEAPPAHLYRHDLESLFYVLFVLVIANNLLKTPKYNDRVPGEKCYLELSVFSHYSKWLEHDDLTLNTEKRHLVTEVTTFPAPADDAFEVLADRVSELHIALGAGFSAQSEHHQRIREALTSAKPRRLFRANAVAQLQVRLPAVTEVELPAFDNSTLDGKWTYAVVFDTFGDDGFEVMYPVACPDT